MGDFLNIDHKIYVVFNFVKEPNHQWNYHNWIEHCKVYQKDFINKIFFYERQYQRTHPTDPLIIKNNMEYYEGFESTKTDTVRAKEELQVADQLPEDFYQSLDRWFKFETFGYIVFCSFDVLELHIGCLVKRAGTFLFVVDFLQILDLKDVAIVLKNAWKKTQNLNIFVFIHDAIYTFNPFQIDNVTRDYGVLVKVVNGFRVKRNLKDLSKYPLRVEIFNSAYSVEIQTNSNNFSGRLDSFYGPDVRTALFIEEQMNASSRYL